MAVNPRPRKTAARPRRRPDPFGEHARSVELLWGERARPSRGPRPGLSVEGIARAAIAIADVEGLAAVSMQRVAGEFGFTPMALYRHVPGKDELVDLMIDTGLGAPPALAALAGGWRPRLHAWARALWDVFHRHPWSLAATNRLRVMGPNELAWADAALAALADTGLSAAERHRVLIVVLGHVRSAAQFSVPGDRGRSLTGPQWTAATAALVQRDPTRFAALQATVAGRLADPGEDDGLEFGLQIVLDGVAALVDRRLHAQR
ncbi:TetR/AcrR family transcriptional regulator C-terminal domain-containing protein [Nannocystis sp. SCPEA4]|uniref:TetR/AcrR family transcriptional regulator n=1 Tax=Nannocystis sp. SCPEA4 TaxID=2996787 RepID=UPI00226EB674|nr:TetR/AcrR family transcriptional regulator C-terminal domain-containing protein [Nannocystis sp. SCPEA4]MCY1062827.1 TetR/AcrR family transcriptional regulator C-terminal domain-containing protein [Nannocystis sp. SCPEA4]